MKTNSINQCPQCGQPISQGIKGLCPNCLALVGFGPEASPAQTVLSDAGQRPESSNNPPLAARPLLPLAARYFGDYELLEEIARGGMGVVYKARQTSLNRIVAVKMILSGQLATEADVKRFRTEAESAANLQHPNIVAIHETGEHEGRHFFSMDYVEGKNLAQTLNGHPLPPGQAAALLKTIAEAVHFAHQRGTLHRDLKPQNVLIDLDGQPRITDFGLAKRLEGDAGLTQTGAAMGSPSFMPPEQAAGRQAQVGPQSDVYALGAILYQLLTGQPPFAGSSPLEIMGKVMEMDPARPSKSHPETPPDLETVCLKCLEKRPERRYHSARELAEELGRFLNHEPILAKPSHALRRVWSWANRHPWVLAASASLLVLYLMVLTYELSERNTYLKWRIAHPDEVKPYAYTIFDSPITPIVVSILVMVSFLPCVELSDRKRRCLLLDRRQLWAYSSFGVFQIALATLLVFKSAYANVWRIELWYTRYVFFVVPFALFWFGILAVWHCLRNHQSFTFGCDRTDKGLTIQHIFVDKRIFYSTVILEAFVMGAASYFITPLWSRLTFLFHSQVGFLLALCGACWWFSTGVGRRFWNFALVLAICSSAFAFRKFEGSKLGVMSWLFGLLTGIVLIKVSNMRRSEPHESLS